MLGWRVWRLRGPALRSWAAGYTWQPGENLARCMATAGTCSRAPGRGCMCGFWALFSPLDAFRRGRSDCDERASVLGLVRGWGEIALHGREGFRAERAAVVALFSDWLWDAGRMPAPDGALGRALWGMGEALYPLRGRVPALHWREQGVRDAAARYGVPVMRLKDAVRYGALSELGVGQAMLGEVEAWLERVATEQRRLIG